MIYQEHDPEFLKVKPGDTVHLVEEEIAKVISFVGGARDPEVPILFLVAILDSREIKFVHGEEVRAIVTSYQQQSQE